jgi:hypothetical protein
MLIADSSRGYWDVHHYKFYFSYIPSLPKQDEKIIFKWDFFVPLLGKIVVACMELSSVGMKMTKLYEFLLILKVSWILAFSFLK